VSHALTFKHAFLALLATVLFVGLSGSVARADDPAHPARATDPEHGLAVMGLGSAVDAAWPLARAVYADAGLRPTTLDEAHARVLVGEPVAESSSTDLRDLAETRAAIHGDDAASRRLLASIASSLHVKGIVVVDAGSAVDPRPAARVYVTSAGAYDAVRYESDRPAPVTWGNGTGAVRWSGAVLALKRGFAEAPALAPAAVSPSVDAANGKPANGKPGVIAMSPTGAVPAAVNKDNGKSSSRPFYQSPWFWAAAGAALFAAGAVYFATRNDGSDNIQLQVQVPR